MNNVIERVWPQSGLTHIEDLKGSVFTAESGGHTFRVTGVDSQGNAVPLTGTVTGVFLRPDNTDVTIAGEASGGVVSVTLPEECYDVQGRFGLTIFLTADGQKTAIYAAVGSVTRASSGNVSPQSSASVVDLINQISAAVATIPASYTGLMADIAPTYSDSAVYAVGQYVYYGGDLYRCTTAISTAESWTAEHWTAAAVGDDIYEVKKDCATIESIIAPTYSSSSLYAVGSYVWYDGILYECTTAITTAEAWDSTHWTAAVIGEEISDTVLTVKRIDGVVFDTEEATLDSAHSTNGSIIQSTGKYTTSTGYTSYFIEIPTGAKLAYIASSAARSCRYTFLATNAHSSGQVVDFASGESMHTLSANRAELLTIPNDAGYLWVSRTGSNGTPESPSQVVVYRVLIPDVDSTLTVSGAAADAKTTGDRLSALESSVSEILQAIQNA